MVAQIPGILFIFPSLPSNHCFPLCSSDRIISIFKVMNSLLCHLYSAIKPFQWICLSWILYFLVLKFLFFMLSTSVLALPIFLFITRIFSFTSMVRNFRVYQNYLESFLNTQPAKSHPKVCDSVDLRWGQQTCISNKFPGDAEAAGAKTTLWEPLIYTTELSCNRGFKILVC